MRWRWSNYVLQEYLCRLGRRRALIFVALVAGQSSVSGKPDASKGRTRGKNLRGMAPMPE
jgi:hypothetical protein